MSLAPEDLADLALDFLAPLAAAVESPTAEQALLAQLGFALDPAISLVAPFRAALEGVAEVAFAFEDAALDGEDTPGPEVVIRALDALRGVISSVFDFAALLDGGAAASALVATTDLVVALPRRLADFLIADLLRRRFPVTFALLRTFALIGVTPVEQLGDPLRTSYERIEVKWEKLAAFLGNPWDFLLAEYRWNDPAGADVPALFQRVDDLATALGLRVAYAGINATAATNLANLVPGGRALDDESASALRFPLLPDRSPAFLELTPLTSAAGAFIGVGASVVLDGGVAVELDLTEDVHARVDLGAAGTAFGVLLRKGAEPAVVSDLMSPGAAPSAVELNAAVTVTYRPADGAPAVLIGRRSASHLAITDVGIRAFVAGGAATDVGASIHLGEGVLVVRGDPDDGVLGSVFGEGIKVPFDFTVGFSTRRGLFFDGGAGFELVLEPQLELGPLFVSRILIGLRIDGGTFGAVLALSGGFKLGNFAAVIDEIGLTAKLATGKAGALGGADLTFGFKPPNGIGLSLSTASLRIGGFLKIDVERGRYYGLLEIALFEKFELVAIGILTTKKPDGSPGFSLLAIISVTFPAPIPLGYNFYLAGVGGLLGLNRSVAIDALRAGLQTGAADNILFPTNVVERVDEIISDLEAMFPEKQGQFVIGPTAKLTWNSPALITAKLGLILEVPSPFRIAILGSLRAALPNEQEPILDLKVNFLGTIDFEAGLLAFDASIYDSYVGKDSFKIWFEGDIALRVCWGKRPDFLVSVGGFHPQFQPPPHLQLPAMKRLSISLLKDNPRLRLTAYFALSTNTVQFGARLDFLFKISEFKVVGEMGFDVLIQFSPFRFMADVYARLAVTFGKVELLAIELDFGLEGPTPWIARGKASFSILFFKVSVQFKAEFGQRAVQEQPSLEVLPLILAELARDANWTGELTEGRAASVQLIADGDAVKKVDGGGSLVFRQKVLPFKVDFDRFGNNVTTDAGRLEIEEVRAGNTSLQLADLTEPFAPAQYRAMKDRDRLAADSYEQMPGGVRTAAGGLRVGSRKSREAVYEQQVFDGEPVVLGVAEQKLPADADEFDRLMKGSAAARSRRGRLAARTPPRARDLQVGDEPFAVVRASDLRPAAEADCEQLPRWRALARLEELVAAGTSRRALLVVPQSQLGKAA